MLPYFALAFGVLALTMSSMFIRWSSAPGPVTSFYRMGLAAVVLLPVIALRAGARRKQPPCESQIAQEACPQTPPRAGWLLFPLAGGLITALDHSAWSLAIDYTRVANATLLNNMAPLWVALFAVFVWRERLLGRFWLGLGLTLVGAAVILGSDMIFSPKLNGGNLLALGSSLFYAAYFLITQRGRSRLDALTYVWMVDLVSALGLLVICGALAMPLTGYDTQTYLIFIAAALISQVGGYFAIAYSLGHLPASIVSPSMVAQPVLTALLAVPFAGEMLSAGQWLGGLAVVAGIYLVNISRRETL